MQAPLLRGFDKGATFSEDRRYRYSLWRIWDGPACDALAFIGLNPSTADESIDDPTIRRCMAFARRMGCGGIFMLNLFAYRSTDPKALTQVDDPVGPDNDFAIRRYSGMHYVWTVAAWGAGGALQGRDKAVLGMVDEVYCLGLTKGGQPRHPLYVKGDTRLVRYGASHSKPSGQSEQAST